MCQKPANNLGNLPFTNSKLPTIFVFLPFMEPSTGCAYTKRSGALYEINSYDEIKSF